MQQGGLQAQTEKRITELKKLTHELEIHGCGQENAIYDLAAEMADVEGSIQKELDHFRQGSTHRSEFHRLLRTAPTHPVWHQPVLVRVPLISGICLMRPDIELSKTTNE